MKLRSLLIGIALTLVSTASVTDPHALVLARRGDGLAYRERDISPGSPSPATTQPGFTDVTTSSGIGKIIDDHYAAHPKWWLSGLHLVDLDSDGDLDLFLSAHARGNAVAAVNDGEGVFALAEGTYPTREIHLCYDGDEDGRVDLTMTHQDGGGQWWHNDTEGSKLLFRPTGITRGTNTARRQALIDINRDGNVDWLRGTGDSIHFDFGDGKGGFVQSSRQLAVTRGRAEVLCLPQDIDGDGEALWPRRARTGRRLGRVLPLRTTDLAEGSSGQYGRGVAGGVKRSRHGGALERSRRERLPAR